ncbi:MAG TPA: hypothetical protein VF950_29370 [Planctomycetota bacterium]
MKTFRRETDLARAVVDLLRAQRWEIYPEVQPKGFKCCADIVAVQGRAVWVVETKLSFGLSVIEQAHDWRKYAHFVSVAVPWSGKTRMAEIICRRLGIGVLRVGATIDERCLPAFNRQALAARITDGLTEKHKTYAAPGNADGRRYTPFRRTCEAVAAAVAARPGLPLAELLDLVQTHYLNRASARTCLPRWIREGIVPGVRLERDGRALRLYPAGKTG